MNKLPLSILITALASFPLQAQNNLTVNISNLTANKGTVEVGIFNKAEGFLKSGKQILKKQVKVSGTKASCTFSNLPKGYYAVAIFQYENSNKKCDTNFIGVPKEPYGFSNNVKPKLSAPDFNQTKVFLNANKVINIDLIN